MNEDDYGTYEREVKVQFTSSALLSERYECRPIPDEIRLFNSGDYSLSI